MPSSTRYVIEPWPIGDLGSADPLTPRIARAVMNNAAHLVDSQCQHLAMWVRPSGSYRTGSASTTPQLISRARVPITRRPDGRCALWVVQLFASSATAGAVTWHVGARPELGTLRRPPTSAETDTTVSVNSTSAVWTAPIYVRPDPLTSPDAIPTTPAVSTTDPLVAAVQQWWASLGIWAAGSVVPRLHGVSVREFGGT